MSRISDIILRARDTLADPIGDRWSDDRLLRLIDEAQKDICRRAKLLRAKATLTIFEGKSTYQMPEDLLLLTRVLVDDKKIDFIDHEELDELNETWETEIGKIKYIVLDRRNRHILKTYKIPDSSAINIVNEYSFINSGYLEDIIYRADSDFGILVDGEESDTFESTCPLDESCGVTTDGTLITNVYDVDGNYLGQIEQPFEFSSGDFGIVGSITDMSKDISVRDSTYGFISELTDFEFDSDFGVFGTIVEAGMEENISSDYGTITEIYETNSSITLYYIKKPSNITLITDELEIDSSFDAAIKYYVVGKALRDDMDTQNRIVGNEELQFYTRELNEAMKDDLYDFVRTGKNYTVKYTGAF